MAELIPDGAVCCPVRHQALLHPQEEGWTRMLDDLETRLIRYPFRMGMGLGGISTAIVSTTIEMPSRKQPSRM